ncbi:MAG: TonB-dependent receptor [Steroidobacteraceae bacterium]
MSWNSYTRTASLVAAAVAAALGTSALQAAESTQEATLEEVIVTGTRATGVALSESATPVQLISAEVLEAAGKPDLMGTLSAVVPSFTAQAFGGDMANQTLQAKLRGLSPNHVLVLVDGKRRHGTSNLAVLSGSYQGGAGVDLNFLPVGAIERVEVLTDGAAAQYGTDAIAGVLNIITKKDSSGGFVDLSYGSYFDQGGQTPGISGGFSLAPAEGAYLTVTGEARQHDHSSRGGIDPRVDAESLAGYSYPDTNLPFAKGYPYVNKISGDGEYDLYMGSLSAGYEFSEDSELYYFGTYGKKRAASFENFRMPSRVSYDPDGAGPAAPIYPFPYGFDPKEESQEIDFSNTLGLTGNVAGWRWDLSTVFGRDKIDIYTLDSANASLYADTGATPRDFFDGTFTAEQWTSGLDVVKDLDMSVPVTFAAGIEFRRDVYEIEPGDAPSRYVEGGQSFPGYALTDAGRHKRNQKAAYVNVVVNPVTQWTIDVAGRYEDYSDFGDTTIGKLTTRYDFTDAFALRGTFSTGFRAPTLAEEFYSATNVGPTTAYVQLPPNAPAAALVGLGDGLQPEKSRNISAGLVFKPMPSLLATLDIYQIKLKNRIVGTGSLNGTVDGEPVAPAITDAIEANGNTLDPEVRATGNTGINIFANGINTRTRGADLVVSYESPFDWGTVNWSLGGTFTRTKVTKVRETPAELAGQRLFDAEALSNLEDTAPDYVLNLGALIKFGSLSINVREVLYGKSELNQTYYGSGSYPTVIKATPITNLDVSWAATEKLSFSIGAQNLFNSYPEKVNEDLLETYRADDDNSAVAIYPSFSPFGFNGGYYYGKVSFKF